MFNKISHFVNFINSSSNTKYIFSSFTAIILIIYSCTLITLALSLAKSLKVTSPDDPDYLTEEEGDEFAYAIWISMFFVYGIIGSMLVLVWNLVF